jgi:hypothetical protein
MAEIEDKNKETLQPPDTQAAVDAPVLSEKPSTPALAPVMSKGEKLYEKAVYTGLNYWANLALSMYVADLFLAGKGNGVYQKISASVNRGLSLLNKNKTFSEEAMQQASHIALSTITLNTGGHITAGILKPVEDHKRPIVHWLNKKFYKQDQIAADGHEQTPDEIYIQNEQPSQSWGRIAVRRLMGMGATVVAGLALDGIGRKKFDTPQTIDGKEVKVIHGQDRFTGIIQNNANKALGFIPGGQKIVNSPTAQRYVGYAALDTFYTWITSAVMRLTNGAKKAQLPNELGDDVGPPAIAIQDKIVILPEGETIIDKKHEERLAGYKKSSIASQHSYVDRIKAEDSNLTLAPR